MKRIEIALIIGILLASFFCADIAAFATGCEEVQDNLLRLHIIANSDGDSDQALKILVRDAVLQKTKGLFEGLNSKEEARAVIMANLNVFSKAAEETLRKNGCGDQVSATLEATYFNTRVYDNVTVPAGQYEALCLRIGEAKGKNWWCVAFPPMCIPAAEKKETLSGVLDEQALDIVSQDAPKYKAEFFIVECFESLKEKWQQAQKPAAENQDKSALVPTQS